MSVVKDEVIDETCEELCSFRAVPKRWDNLMKRNEKLGKFRQALSRWCQGLSSVAKAARGECKVKRTPELTAPAAKSHE